MKITEMEWHHDELTAVESRVRSMADNYQFPDVFSACQESFEHIVPAIKYRKKREIQPETPSLLSFRVICKYAPPLFEHSALESLLDFVKSTRPLAKHEKGYLQHAEMALEREEIARIVWNKLEREPGFSQRHIRRELGVDQESAVDVVKIWEELGLIIRSPENESYLLYLRSRLGATVTGICQTCGKRGMARKEQFLRRIACSACGANDYYHLVSTKQE